MASMDELWGRSPPVAESISFVERTPKPNAIISCKLMSFYAYLKYIPYGLSMVIRPSIMNLTGFTRILRVT